MDSTLVVSSQMYTSPSKMMRNAIKPSLMEMTADVGLSLSLNKKKMAPGGPPISATHEDM